MNKTVNAETPTYPHGLIGFRYWSVIGDHLTGVSQHSVWRPNSTFSHCTNGHAGPVTSCQCGLHAYRDETELLCQEQRQSRRGAQIMGVVIGRGQCEMHTTGWRAEEAAIVAIAAINPDDQTLAENIAQQYGVPCLQRQQLTDYAQQYGQPFTELMPEASPSAVHTPAVMSRWQNLLTHGFGIVATLGLAMVFFSFLMGTLTFHAKDELKDIPNGPLQHHLVTFKSGDRPEVQWMAPIATWQRYATPGWIAALTDRLQDHDSGRNNHFYNLPATETMPRQIAWLQKAIRESAKYARSQIKTADKLLQIAFIVCGIGLAGFAVMSLLNWWIANKQRSNDIGNTSVV